MDAIHHLLGGDRETCPQPDVPDVGLLHTDEDALSKQGGRPRQRCQWRQDKEDVLAVFNDSALELVLPQLWICFPTAVRCTGG